MVENLDVLFRVLIWGFILGGSVASLVKMVRRGPVEHTGYSQLNAFNDLRKWAGKRFRRGPATPPADPGHARSGPRG